MKRIFKKNQVIITALAVLIAVAGYLSFADVDLGGKNKEKEKDKEASTQSSTILEDIDSLDYDVSDETALLEENQNAQVTEGAEQEDAGETGQEGAGEDAANSEAVQDTPAPDGTEASPEGTTASGEDTSVTDTPGEAVLTGSSNFAAQAKISREQVRSQNKANLLEIINNQDITEEQKQEAVNSMVEMTELAEKEAAAEAMLEAKGFSNVVVNLTGETADVVVPSSDITDAQRAQIEDIVKRKTGIVPEQIVISSLNGEE